MKLRNFLGEEYTHNTLGATYGKRPKGDCCDMSVSQYFNRSCPQPVGVNVTQNVLSLGRDLAAIQTYDPGPREGTAILLDLPHRISPLFRTEVYINGVLQKETVHYQALEMAQNSAIQFTDTVRLELTDRVQVLYAEAL